MQTYPLIGNYGAMREDFEGGCFVWGRHCRVPRVTRFRGNPPPLFCLCEMRCAFRREKHRRAENQVIQREPIGGACHRRLSQPVAGGALTERLASHALNLIFQVRILEAPESPFHRGAARFRGEAELPYQALAALLHCVVNNISDYGVLDW